MPLSDQQRETRDHLQQLARSVVQACPDMRQMARDTAQALLARLGHGELDPDGVFLNRFHTAQSSPRTFSGWEHYERPFQSLTLPQLVMQRFDAQASDNADLLGYLTGFYKEDCSHDVFDERNEVPIAPSDVLQAFWDIDFCTAFKEKLQRFWEAHADDYRTLAKANFLGKVMETCASEDNPLLAAQVRRLGMALTGADDLPPSLEQMQAAQSAPSGYRLCTFDIGGHVASDILRVVLANGGQFLYIPGEVEPLLYFADRKALYWWVLKNTNPAYNRARCLGHFPLASHAERNSDVGLHHMIDLLFFNWGGHDHDSLNQLDTTLDGDAFDHLRDAMRQRMHDDAEFALRSNADLRKQLWIGYLRALGEVFGPMAAVDWPVALAVVGAGLAETGLNIDQAVNGHTTAERHAGVVGAVIAAVNTLFNATLLAAGEAKAVEALGETETLTPELHEQAPTPLEEEQPASQAEIEAWVPEPLRPVAQQRLLAPFETNVVLASEPGEGMMAGIYTEEGHFYALVDDMPYQVRYVGEMHTWVVIDPENPYSFYRNVPLRMTEQGQWQPMERTGLNGGALSRKAMKIWGQVTAKTPAAPLPSSPYEMPEALRSTLRAQTLDPDNRVLAGIFGSTNPAVEDACIEFRKLRDALAKDAQAFFEAPELPARPKIPELPGDSSPKQLIEAVYQQSEGLVVGETHAKAGSKRFLIDNMPHLKQQKVEVLYLEHFMTDFHQADLDLFGQTGKMPEDLSRYVKNLDIGHGTDRARGYTFQQVLIAAQKQGIQLRAIDCLASYRQAWMDRPLPLTRHRMMNFYAHQVIQADQLAQGPRRWVALVGNTHSNTFEGVPGVSELEGAIGLRVEDVSMNQPDRIGLDPGISVIDLDLSVQYARGDLRLQAALAAPKPEVQLERILEQKGTFSFKDVDGEVNLVHRSKDGQLKFTPIRRDGEHYYLERPEWPWISGRRFDGLQQIHGALSRKGLKYKLIV